jgi:GTP 3',8-cyclase
MPKTQFGPGHVFLPQASLLSFEEITRLARLFAAHGVRKLRLTGGEPLLRKGLEELVHELAALRTPDGQPLDLALTTNGSLLRRKAAGLAAAGLQRVTISLDALDDALFRRMNDMDCGVADVLDGIQAAHESGLAPVKVNMVVQRGVNDHQIEPMAAHFRGTDVVLRFIEYMDVGHSNGWRLKDVVPSSEVRRRLSKSWPLEPLQTAAVADQTAERWRYADGAGEVGFISSVTQAFCGDCSRARLSTEGKLFLCLFATRGHDLRALLRGGRSDAEISAAIGKLWGRRSDRYSELRGSADGADAEAGRRIEMHYIGG